MRKPPKRRAAVTVEFAFALPILLGGIFTGIEFARVNMIRNTIENAAYEGARTGVVPGATAAECENAAQQIIDLIGVAGAVPVATITADDVTVTVSVPLTASNGYITPKYYLGKSLQSSITLPLEIVF